MSVSYEQEGLSQKSAVHFLENKLNISRVLERFSSGATRRSLLDEIVYKLHGWIPFHTMYMLSQKPGAREACAVEDTVKRLLDGTGGLCWTNNCATYFLLKAIGFEVTLRMARVVIMYPNTAPNHVVVVLRNLEASGDRFLVDIGIGFPTFSAVDLAFENESEEYCHTVCRYKFVKDGDTILRQHFLETDSHPFAIKASPQWGVACKIDLARDFSPDQARDFINTSVFKNPEIYFHTLFQLCRYEKGKRILIRQNDLIIEDPDTAVMHRQTLTQDAKELINIVLQHFPNMNEELVKGGLHNWKA